MKNLKEKLIRLLGKEYTYPAVTKELSNFASKYQLQETKYKEVDIIIPTFNRFRETKRTISALYSNVKIPFKLIIVDNGSSDKTIGYLRKLETSKNNLKIIFLQNNPGAAAARTAGLKESSNEYVAFLDNDIITMPYYFENLIDTLNKNPDAAAAQSKVVLPNRLIQINRPTFEVDNQWILFFDKDSAKIYNDSSTFEQESCKWIPIGATLWRRELFNKYSFDKEMGTSYEDNDLAYSLFKDGYKFLNCPSAICLHINSEFAPDEDQNKEYSKGRFGVENVRNSAKHFFYKHHLFFGYGDIEGYCKHLGFNSIEEYISFITS